MKTFLPLVARVCGIVLTMVILCGPARAQTTTAENVSAANKFLATLSPQQRQKVLYAYDDAQQRTRWSNFPTGFVPRGGISLKQMTAAQRDAAMKLLATVLSPMGLEKVNEVREADDDTKPGPPANQAC